MMVMLMMMETADDRDLWIPIYIYIGPVNGAFSCTTVSHVHKGFLAAISKLICGFIYSLSFSWLGACHG